MASLAQISNAGATPTSLSGSRCATVVVVRPLPNPSSQATCHNLLWTEIKPTGKALQLQLARHCLANLVVDNHTRTQTIRASIPYPDLTPVKLGFTLGIILIAVIESKGTYIGLTAPIRLIRAWWGGHFDAQHVDHQLDQLPLKSQCSAMS